MARNTDHVVARTDGAPGTMPLECLHCGAKLVLTLPVSISVMAAASKAFVGEHAECRPSPATGGEATAASPVCAKCGRPKGDHNRRHPFVAVGGA